MSEPTAYEQYLLELINAERAAAGAQPLADNVQLNAAAGGHSQWMIDADTFSHTGAGGSSPTARMQAAGFQFTGSWSNGENIAWMSLQQPAGFADEVSQLNTNLMNSPDHRTNLLDAAFSQVGLGFRVGEFQGWQGAFVTEDFAHVGSQRFLTGAAFADANGDGAYEPGEGLGGMTVSAVSAAGAAYSMLTYGSGGYDLALPSGSYTVTFTAASGASSSQHVDIGTANVHLDLAAPGQPITPPGSLTGGAGADSLAGLAGVDNRIRGGAGADTLAGADRFNDVNGNQGNDLIIGRSTVGDWLLGGQGADQIDATASSGHNILNGNLGADTVTGGSGGDTLRGGQGDDMIRGGSGNDLLVGDLGTNTLSGGAGADTFHNGAGLARDVITDFNPAQGDHVQISVSLTFVASQAGADVEIDVSNGDVMVLQNTQLTSLGPDWLVHV